MKRLVVIILLSVMGLLTNDDLNASQKLEIKEIKRIMMDVASYQVKNPTHHRSKNRDFPNGWVPASFYIGMITAYEATQDKYYLKRTQKWAKKNNYELGPRLRHADDHACGSVYLSLPSSFSSDEQLVSVRAVYDSLMATPVPGREDWWWCDALFMSPPTLAQLGKVTGEKKYFTYLHQMYWDTAEHLFDKNEALFYRDQRYFYRRSASGKKVFWSRGNGWVFAGLPRIISNLPEKDKQRTSYIELFKTLAGSLSALQGQDGLWRSSLLDAQEYPNPESSGSGFIIYALAWGINNGYLDHGVYGPIVWKGWRELVQTVHPNGKIGWVQDIGMDPKDVSFNDTHAYGAGAFLLAGSEMIKILKNYGNSFDE